MPKTFSEKERTFIKTRLREEAFNCLRLYGMKRTTVDELVRRVHIPKGTFYLFYASKELLIYDVLNTFHEEVHAELHGQLENLHDPVSVELFTELVFNLYRKVETSGLYTFMTNGDWELLMRKLPPETTLEQEHEDDISIERLLGMVPGMTSSNENIYGAALRAVFFSMMHKHEIGEDVFESSLKMLIRGIFLQIFEEGTT